MAVCLITGCSSGFGEAIALAFARRGDTVIATMRNPAAAPESLRSAANIEIAPLDVIDEASRTAAIESAVARHGRIDVLVNNAGISGAAPIEDASDAVVREMFEINLFAPLALMRAVLPVMRDNGGGRIVNITAIGAVIATPLLGIYCATKHALDCASAALDIEGRPFGVRVPTVLPGQFQTPILGKSKPVISDPYLDMAAALKAVREATAADFLTDLTPVTDAVIAAATDPEPQQRYVAGVGLATKILPAVAELEKLHAFSAVRAGQA